MKHLQNKKPSSVGKRYPGQQHNFGKPVAQRNDSKVYAENVTYLSEFTGKEPDAITVLFCIGDHIATKTHVKTEDGVTTLGFSAGKFFTSQIIPVNDITELSEKLTMIEKIKVALLIRGRPLPHVKLDVPHQRLKRVPGATYLSPADGHHHFELDIDKMPLPEGMLLTPDNVPAVIALVVSTLPEEFHNVSFHYQLSSSAGIHDQSKVSMHLWFWSDRKLRDDELKRWGKHLNQQVGYKLIDTALFNDVQPHFVAAPDFIGMDDPFPQRSGLIRKAHDCVSVVIPDPVTRPAKPASAKHGSGTRLGQASTRGFDNFLAEIGDHPGGDGFNAPIIRAIASHVSTVTAEKFDREWLKATMRERILAADSSNHDLIYIETKISDHYLNSAIDGAILKFGHKKSARLIPGQPPHHQTKRISASDAFTQLKSTIRRFFR